MKEIEAKILEINPEMISQKILSLGAKKIHWPLTDPAKATGTEEQVMSQFRATRDEVEARVRGLLASLAEGNER